MQNVNAAKKNVDTVYNDMAAVLEKSKSITENTNLTAAAAKSGGQLMQEAMLKMSNFFALIVGYCAGIARRNRQIYSIGARQCNG